MPSATSLAPMVSVAEMCPSLFAVIVIPDKVDVPPSSAGCVVSVSIAASSIPADEFRILHNLTPQARLRRQKASLRSESSFEAQEHRCALVAVARLTFRMKSSKRQNFVIAPKAADAKAIVLSDERGTSEDDLRPRRPKPLKRQSRCEQTGRDRVLSGAADT